jgi:hypothetical protein
MTMQSPPHKPIKPVDRRAARPPDNPIKPVKPVVTPDRRGARPPNQPVVPKPTKPKGN